MRISSNVIGGAALTLGVVTAATPAWAATTPVSAAATIGLGAMTAVYAMWSLIARDPTKDHWALSVVGFVLFLTPWLGDFAGTAAGWVAWIAGAAITLLAGGAYVADEADSVTVREEVSRQVAYLRERDEILAAKPGADRQSGVAA
ncbi:SPW repeat domain-containing protein [Nocardia higoensis]|uniref:SPW repeat domain-containing protein n=1 Tax=Nocardia higoensis TaxID=228599 RepID=UPI001575CB8E|nr:hypothetical protein [Nocardia higoensis]